MTKPTSRLIAHLVSPDGLTEVRLYASGVVTSRDGWAKQRRGYRRWRRLTMVGYPEQVAKSYLERGWKHVEGVRAR